MKNFKELLIAFHEDEDGATATEYIILLILIAVLVIAIVKTFGQTIEEKFIEGEEEVDSEVNFDDRAHGG